MAGDEPAEGAEGKKGVTFRFENGVTAVFEDAVITGEPPTAPQRASGWIGRLKGRGSKPPWWIWVILPIGCFSQSALMDEAIMKTDSWRNGLGSINHALVDYHIGDHRIMPIAACAAIVLLSYTHFFAAVPLVAFCGLLAIAAGLDYGGNDLSGLSLLLHLVSLAGLGAGLMSAAAITDYYWPRNRQ